MSASVALPGAVAANTVTLPAGAVFQHGAQAAVWVVNAQQQVRAVPVQIVQYREDSVLVSGALPAGSRVIAAGRTNCTTARPSCRNRTRRGAACDRFNLSEWALAHRNFVLYVMVLLTALGVMAYGKLGQSEDPPFTFKVMLVQAYWPGATAKQMEQLVADRIEKTLLETPHIDTVKSFSRPGETQLFVTAQDATPNRDMPDFFYQVRKRVTDIQRTLPQGVQGPYFNDDFGETYGNVFALTGDGFSIAQLRDVADDMRKELLRVPGVAKVDVIGVQDEKIYIDLSNQKLANLGFNAQDLINALQQWNSVNAAGSFETASDRIYLRPSGAFKTVAELPTCRSRSARVPCCSRTWPKYGAAMPIRTSRRCAMKARPPSALACR
jgi:Cation/multidrug efflux pump